MLKYYSIICDITKAVDNINLERSLSNLSNSKVGDKSNFSMEVDISIWKNDEKNMQNKHIQNQPDENFNQKLNILKEIKQKKSSNKKEVTKGKIITTKAPSKTNTQISANIINEVKINK